MSPRIALAQTRSLVGSDDMDPRKPNLDTALKWIMRAAEEGADLVVFGEMHLSGYRTDEHLHKYATVLDPPDRYVRGLIAAAKEYSTYIIMGAATFGSRMPGDIYNSALLIGEEGLVGTYRKAHVGALTYDNGVSMERSFYSPGKELPVFDTPLGQIGIQICYDICFPEVSRVQALKGADLLVNVAASVVGFEDLWSHYLFARAAENACWYLVCSIVGRQRNDNLFGHSRVIHPSGKLVAEAKKNMEDFLLVDIDLEANRRARARSHLFSQRNPSLYSPISDESPYP